MYHDGDGGRIGPLAFCSFGDESKDQIILSGVAGFRGKKKKGTQRSVLHPMILDTGKRERHVCGQPVLSLACSLSESGKMCAISQRDLGEKWIFAMIKTAVRAMNSYGQLRYECIRP